MKSIKDITIGSRAFFYGYSDFISKDLDILHIMDNVKNNNIKSISFQDENIDHILIMDKNKNDLINRTLKKGGIAVGKFMVPEVVEYYGVTIDELKQFEEIINNLDDKHKYYKKIYDAYIENGKFEMNDEQLLAAYGEYKKYRQ